MLSQNIQKVANTTIFRQYDTIWKFFDGVSHVTSTICLTGIRRKSVLTFLEPTRPQKIPKHDVKAPKKCKNDASCSRFWVKICEMCYFWMFSIRQTLKYTPKKIFIWSYFCVQCGMLTSHQWLREYIRIQTWQKPCFFTHVCSSKLTNFLGLYHKKITRIQK